MFKFKNATYITGAVSSKQWIIDDLPEFCIIGRSNVGKSTFINFLTNNKKLARISSTPGKTRLLHFFSVNNNDFRIVDAPGYGFAKINNKQKNMFASMMDEYLTKRNNLIFVALLMDLRRIPSNDDVDMYNFLKYNNKKVIIIGTKLDKLKSNDIRKNVNVIKQKLNFSNSDEFIKISSLKKIGRDECWELFANLLKELNNGEDL